VPLGRLEIDSLNAINCISKQDLYLRPVLCAQAMQAVNGRDTKSKHYIPEGDRRRALYPLKKKTMMCGICFSVNGKMQL